MQRHSPELPQGLNEEWKVPEILAPAGGRAQFFAALQAGADAVYLGLKNFNARGRAENFSQEDLRELAPLARQRGMKILVTLNILLKEIELPQLIAELAELQFTGIDAVIVQDPGVARLIRHQFPSLRLHASTQMAVHNKAGVLAAAELGFRRVVLARELTAQEIRRIRREVSPELIEIEAFCHGSLCYSYSGLCFFSGAEDARSGNRGECAYTCRKPYKILNEPGHGFLFSMKDLDTSLSLEKLVEAGVDTLKIEGRKKDAQYVATTVGLYRQRLNEIFGRETARVAPGPRRDFRSDMAFSFHRDTTSLFTLGRYHENVIDLANPTHVGKLLGPVLAVAPGSIEFATSEKLERFDGLRLESAKNTYHAAPQHGQELRSSTAVAREKYETGGAQFSLRDFLVKGQRANACEAGQRVRVLLPPDIAAPRVGDLVYKIRSNELKRHTEQLAQAPEGSRLRALRKIELQLDCRALEGAALAIEAIARLGGEELFTHSFQTAAERPRQAPRLSSDLQELMHIFGELGLEAELEIRGDSAWFVARSQLKRLKQELAAGLEAALAHFEAAKLRSSRAWIDEGRAPLQARAAQSSFQIKIDRLEYLPLLAAYQEKRPAWRWDELIFEPKRAFLGVQRPAETFATLKSFADAAGLRLRLALPTVIRAWDEPLLKAWVQAFRELGGRAFEIGNLGCLPLLRSFGLDPAELDLSSDFTLYTLNTEAVQTLADLGISRYALSVEDDALSIGEKLRRWPEAAGEPQLILYKDTPLFIAEACSLTALHHGCPTAQVCGYRTLEIVNDEGEKFFVAHESCKSIVYGAEALSWSQHRKTLEAQGVRHFRCDFLTRPYAASDLERILDGLQAGSRLPETQSANFSRELL